MQFLPIFLDLQSGPVILVGAGELAAAKLRVLTSAGARVRWYATAQGSAPRELEPQIAARVTLEAGDPLTADLKGVIAVVCAGAGETGIAMSARAKSLGLPVNVMDDLVHSTFIFPAIVDRGEVVVAVGTGGASPVVARRVRERIEGMARHRGIDLARVEIHVITAPVLRLDRGPDRARLWETTRRLRPRPCGSSSRVL